MLRSAQRVWSNSGLSLRRGCSAFLSTATPLETRQPLTNLYKSNVVSGLLSYDERQFKLVKLLEKLQKLIEQENVNELTPVTPPIEAPPSVESDMGTETTQEASPLQETKQRLRGLYMYGEVGTGKTMLMDMFFSSVEIEQKRRVHFSEFMLEVHSRIHKHKQKLLQQFGRDINLNLSSERDSITIVAGDIATEARVLCFDEFQVTDICDAMILTRLFNELWRRNVVLIATSNRPPGDLYLNGLNRQYFLPFIHQLQLNCIVRNINIEKDYRQGGETAPNAYFVGNTTTNTEKLHGLYLSDLAERGHDKCGEVTIPVMNNRTLTLKRANISAGVCHVDFAALCETDKGASDYQALCTYFHTIYMPHIPVLSVLAHNEARRLITLIDAMYNANVRFVWVADAQPAQLFEILTREEIEGAEGAGLGTDHNWANNNSSGSSGSSGSNSNVPISEESTSTRHSVNNTINNTNTNTTNNTSTPKERHLRGEEQARRPLDSNMFFGTAIKLRSTTNKTASANNTSANSTTNNTSNDTINENANTTPTTTNTTPSNTTDATTTTTTDAAQDEMKVLEGELASVQELSFAFRRAASRLTEMSSVGYLQDRWRKS